MLCQSCQSCLALFKFLTTPTFIYIHILSSSQLKVELSKEIESKFKPQTSLCTSLIMDQMFESSTSEGIQLTKMPASSSASLERRRKKQAAEEEETHRTINLTVKGQDKVITFKVKPTIKLQKILKTFCEKARVEYKTMRFLFDGSRFSSMATPDELNMCDGDEIQAVGWQVGGGGTADVF